LEHYREILLKRVLAYRAKVLAGIADYAGDDGNVSPSAELRSAARK
jgi:hypothetical protein